MHVRFFPPQFCDIVDGGSCVQSPGMDQSEPYGDDITCDITPTAGIAIKLSGSFDVQAGDGNGGSSACVNDYLEIDGVKFCNTDNAFSTAIANPTGNADTIKFVSNDDGVTGNGWKICQYAPPAPPAIPSPMSPPPPMPSPPGTLCEDSCSTKNNGVCEDPYGDPDQPKFFSYDPDVEVGSIGSCKAGTDCTDCERPTRARAHACTALA